MRLHAAALAAAVCGVSHVQRAAAQATSYTLTSALGGQFWGVGGISGGGATSRLLFSYPQQQRDDILDYLFKPNYGASLHVLKVEIGGGAQSTEGTEASHMYTADDLDYTRGYEWQLMVEAKKRNPAIKLGALPWTFPGWLDTKNGPGRKSPWTNVTATVSYIVNWLTGAKSVYGLDIDYIGGWNERGYSSTYFKALRVAMDAAGFTGTHIVCGDFPHMFECSKEVAADPSLKGIVLALGAHQPQAYDPVGASTGLPMWSTEAHYNVPSGADWALLMNQLYIDKNVTGYQSWALVSAYDEYLAFPDHGLFRAWWPTSGHYELIGRMWVTAHTAQAALADGNWHYLANRTGAGYLQAGGSYVTLRNAKTGDWSLIVEKQSSDPGRPAAETATFHLDATLAGAAAQLQVWKSTVSGAVPDNNTDAYFLQQAPITLGAGVTSFTLTLNVGDVYTVTTLTTLHKGTTPAPPPPATPFPTTWADTFESCVVGQEADYFTSQDGSFLCTKSTDGSGNVVMAQHAATWPVQWRPDNGKPLTVGGSALWRDTNATIRFRLSADGESAMLAARCWVDNTLGAAGPISSEMWMRGAWIRVDGGTGDWGLYRSYANASATYQPLKTGTAAAPPRAGEWHTLNVAVTQAGGASGSLDGSPLFAGVPAAEFPGTGYVGLGVADYGQFAEFDDLDVQAAY